MYALSDSESLGSILNEISSKIDSSPSYTTPKITQNRKEAENKASSMMLHDMACGSLPIVIPRSLYQEQKFRFSAYHRAVRYSNDLDLARAVAEDIFERLASPAYIQDIFGVPEFGRMAWSEAFHLLLDKVPSRVEQIIRVRTTGPRHQLNAENEICLAGNLLQETARYFVDARGCPPVRSRRQAAMYLISSDSDHRKLGAAWFQEDSSRKRSSWWWNKDTPNISLFRASCMLSGKQDVFAEAI